LSSGSLIRFCKDVIDEIATTRAQISAQDIEITNNNIGEGYFGQVKRGRLRGRDVAVKTIRRANFRSHTELDLLVKEIAIMSQLSHINVIDFVGVAKGGSDYLIVTSFEAGGSLRDRIERKAQTIDAEFRLRIALDIANGVRYLHSFRPRPVIHRDLTTANVLLTSPDNGARARLCDFGLSRIKSESGTMTAAIGNLPYMAPECFRGERYDQSCDVYSFGMVVWELVSMRRLPPSGLTCHLFATKAAVDDYRPPLSAASSKWAALIGACWCPEASARLTAVEIVNRLEALQPTRSSNAFAQGSMTASPLFSQSSAASQSSQTREDHYTDPHLASNSIGYVIPAAHDASQQSQQHSAFVIDSTAVMAGHTGAVAAILSTNNGDTIVTGSTDQSIKIWQMSNSACASTFAGHAGYVFCLDSGVVRGTAILLSGSRDKTIRVWNGAGETLLALSGHQGGVRDVHISDETCVSASEDGAVCVWDISSATGTRVWQAAHRASVVYTCTFIVAGDANTVASGGDDGSVRIWDVRNASSTPVGVLEGHTAGVQRVRVDGTELFSASKDGRSLRFDLRTMTIMTEYRGHKNTVFDISVQPAMLISGESVTPVKA
jgi:serine/threonine protein kinase